MTSHNRHSLTDQFVDSANLSWRVLSAVTRTFGSSRFFLHLAGKSRRFLLVHFSRGYVQEQLSSRQGECRQCGACCNLLFTCPSLTKDGGCIIYNICRPQACKVFPIDQRDIDEAAACGGRCGYHFFDRSLERSHSKQKD